MKDLTHYFVSPPKSREPDQHETDTDTVITASVETVSTNIVNNKIDSTPIESSKKRSRVKIKISSKDSLTKRCDIIESADDVIDKTPSPFKRAIVDNQETPNAFKLLMTRQAPKTATTNIKRKLTETEEIEAAKKRPKLLEVNDDADANTKKKTRKGSFGDDTDNMFAHESIYSTENGTRKKKSRADDRLDDNNAKHRSKKVSQSENAAPRATAVALGKELTPKNKTKWTMRVKLQSYSDDEEAEGERASHFHIFDIFNPV